ncbi:betaine/proline/choline family ABC transporter ATP-binding protein [Clostridium chrysemydis]|uniref:betaine/proline/choline family ABC transporter ATP-binding protein n=1 Tax=Clostridium chrysemydis TaxID=2665504 RepID=UPI001884162F|nr:betaine/proline/choline family ABC transporter ATP-binding protein [Clostridium chrysemydis]
MIEIKNVSKKLGNNLILDDISLNIDKGSLVVIIGSSGCGKTTTLKLINKLIEPSSGEIFIDGKPLSKENPINLRRHIGYVIQNTGLFPHLTIKENIELIPRLKKEKTIEEIEKRTVELLKMVGLDPDINLSKYPVELSGGQQQRVGVARAFATDAEIILMDEPFSALDPITRSALQEELFSLQEEFHKTIVFVTHDMDEALKIADKICIMHKGKIAQYDTPENILRNPSNDFIKNFIGTERVWNNPEFIKATDIMIKDPVSIKSSRTILQGIEIMRTSKVDSLLITDKDNTLLGIVTLKDIKRSLDKSTLLKDIMSRNLLTVNLDDTLVQILAVMNEHSVGYIPVTSKDNKLVGLITRSSLLSVLSEQFLDMEVSVLG